MDRGFVIGLSAFVLTASVLAIPTVAHSQPGRHGAAMTRATLEAHVAERFSLIDANGDGAVTQDEIAARRTVGIDRRFDRLDADNDGEITQAERDAAREARRSRRGGARIRREINGEQMIAEERNMRERLTLPQGEEAAGRLSERRARWQARRAAAWEAADADGNGALNRAEFAAMAEARGARASQRRAGRFGQADANGDGRISLAEMSARALARFDAMDGDENGVVTREERREARQAYRRAMRIENDGNRVY